MKKKIRYLLAAFAMLTSQILPIANVCATQTISNVNYSYTGGCAEIAISGGDIGIDPSTDCVWDSRQADGNLNTSINYDYNDSGYVNVQLQTMFVKRLTSVVINGTEYNTDPNFPTTPAQIMEAISDQHIHYSLSVPYSSTGYIISTTAVDNTDEYMTVGNFLWSYMDQDKDGDDYVGHGKLELIKAVYNGTEYTQEQLNNLNKGYIFWNEKPDGSEGGAMLPYGVEVTVKLIPDVGYQLTEFTLNGFPFAAQEAVGTYKFTIPRGNFHLGAHFTKVNDAVKADHADAVTSGSITLGGNEFNNGTARLDVKNAEGLEPADIDGFKDNIEGYNLKTVLDISLFNTIYKGSANESWDIQHNELDHEATITLKLDPSVDGNDVIIVHQKHDGSYEVIPTVYDPVNHTITFKTSSFSNYAIATRTIASPNTGYMTKEGGSVVEDNTAITIIGTLSLWGLLAFVAKKGLAND